MSHRVNTNESSERGFTNENERGTQMSRISSQKQLTSRREFGFSPELPSLPSASSILVYPVGTITVVPPSLLTPLLLEPQIDRSRGFPSQHCYSSFKERLITQMKDQQQQPKRLEKLPKRQEELYQPSSQYAAFFSAPQPCYPPQKSLKKKMQLSPPPTSAQSKGLTFQQVIQHAMKSNDQTQSSSNAYTGRHTRRAIIIGDDGGPITRSGQVSSAVRMLTRIQQDSETVLPVFLPLPSLILGSPLNNMAFFKNKDDTSTLTDCRGHGVIQTDLTITKNSTKTLTNTQTQSQRDIEYTAIASTPSTSAISNNVIQLPQKNLYQKYLQSIKRQQVAEKKAAAAAAATAAATVTAATSAKIVLAEFDQEKQLSSMVQNEKLKTMNEARQFSLPTRTYEHRWTEESNKKEVAIGISDLHFPARQTELEQFRQALEKNEMRFTSAARQATTTTTTINSKKPPPPLREIITSRNKLNDSSTTTRLKTKFTTLTTEGEEEKPIRSSFILDQLKQLQQQQQQSINSLITNKITSRNKNIFKPQINDDYQQMTLPPQIETPSEITKTLRQPISTRRTRSTHVPPPLQTLQTTISTEQNIQMPMIINTRKSIEFSPHRNRSSEVVKHPELFNRPTRQSIAQLPYQANPPSPQQSPKLANSPSPRQSRVFSLMPTKVSSTRTPSLILFQVQSTRGNNNDNHGQSIPSDSSEDDTSSQSSDHSVIKEVVPKIQRNQSLKKFQPSRQYSLEDLNVEGQVAEKAELVDLLQQQKLSMRQAMEGFLNSSNGKHAKAIKKHCMMEVEAFLFFAMHFLQFCIDSMFFEFKQSLAKKQAAVSAAHSNNAEDLPFIENQMMLALKENHPPRFAFNQKIPDDLIMPVINEIFASKAITAVSGHVFFKEHVDKCLATWILPVTLIDKIGGFQRVRQLILNGIKLINESLTGASHMNVIDEKDKRLVDKHIMPFLCALLNRDIDTVAQQVNLFKEFQTDGLSAYDFFTFKRIAWELLGQVKLAHELKMQVIGYIEGLRWELFVSPGCAGEIAKLAAAVPRTYEVGSLLRNPTVQNECVNFFTGLFKTIYGQMSFEQFVETHVAKQLRVQMNERCFDTLEKFLVEELSARFETRVVVDVRMKMFKLKMQANLAFDVFSLVGGGDTNVFYSEELLPFLTEWVRKQSSKDLLTNIKEVDDFKFLEIFVKWALQKNDVYSILDSEPAITHFAISEDTLDLWIQGIYKFLHSIKKYPKQKATQVRAYINKLWLLERMQK